MSRISYFGGKPTQIRPTLTEYLSPSERSYTLTEGTAFDTKWTRRMLQRLQSLSRYSLEDTTILATLKEEFGAPETVEEIVQERAFLATADLLASRPDVGCDGTQNATEAGENEVNRQRLTKACVTEMDFIGNIGERYLVGKANAVPQQLENLAKKQVKGDDSAAKTKSPDQNAGKDKEIEKLRTELAKAKLAQEKQAKETRARVETGKTEERRKKSHSVAGSTSGKSPRSKHAHSKQRDAAAEFEDMPRRGRSDSIKTAFAARPQITDLMHRKETPKSHSTGGKDRGKAPEAGHENLSTVEVSHVWKSPATRGDDIPQTAQPVVSERPSPATDLCVVEVTEEEPRRRRTTHSGRAHVVEVIEKDRNRTRYVIK
ncbi:MAG: hypothetical protein LQ348_006801 [Seirophora lacunosa]|nr:MAG: hypothetical protein LQ348_006801 [Seirophora lacunosa]